MLETLRNAFKIKDIRKKIIFTFLMLIVIRIGSCLLVLTVMYLRTGLQARPQMEWDSLMQSREVLSTECLSLH
jgi:preprotein translocase subunit SecY